MVWFRSSRSMSLFNVSQGSKSTRMIVRIRLLGDGKEMRSLLGPRLAGIDLDHGGDVERVDPGKRIRGNEDYARVCVDFLLGISELDGLQDCGGVSGCPSERPERRWYRLARSDVTSWSDHRSPRAWLGSSAEAASISTGRRGGSRWSCRRSWSGRSVRIEETSKSSNHDCSHVWEAMATATAGRAGEFPKRQR